MPDRNYELVSRLFFTSKDNLPQIVIEILDKDASPIGGEDLVVSLLFNCLLSGDQLVFDEADPVNIVQLSQIRQISQLSEDQVNNAILKGLSEYPAELEMIDEYMRRVEGNQ